MRGAFMFYKLIDDVAHLMHPWFHSHSRAKRMLCFKKMSIGISYNLTLELP
jgi:hypothetical protein